MLLTMNSGVPFIYSIFFVRCCLCYVLDLDMFNTWANSVCTSMSPFWNQVIIGILENELVVSASGNKSSSEYRGMNNGGVPVFAGYQFCEETENVANLEMTIITTCDKIANLTQQEFDYFGLSQAQMQVPGPRRTQQREISLEEERAEIAEAARLQNLRDPGFILDRQTRSN
ncbi:predicted protein [Meyerozyma guilliermondii ATCC 6260]|uniref:Uncharacterized protein n=1 Tax=Meyerozyma guilliermondii (strain ATCC 6260 / CBS 566 / DSM 6381 / JCM 1539 / NBRC 10279 / NRRL Y-324) TaxID=294746 RepID=A5DQX8_PICGU|nr:uncharacterized protein PGUG_05679 [Meyerozyma guilliermondii ATCC 6260]EDK41581.1 predicted protein [Meyerozyma guilliermondii ATCC 6260]